MGITMPPCRLTGLGADSALAPSYAARGFQMSVRRPARNSPEDIAEQRKLRRPVSRFALMTLLFFLSGIVVWALFLAYINGKEKAMEPYGMPFDEWRGRYLVALLIGIILLIVIGLVAR